MTLLPPGGRHQLVGVWIADGPSWTRPCSFSPQVLVCLLGWFCLAMLYFGLFEGLWGAAAGKALCRLRVVGPDRNPPGFVRAWLRALVYLVPPMLPYWWSLARIRRPT